jgi:predicted ATP-grasp superfamily ATP-dependent carboligase
MSVIVTGASRRASLAIVRSLGQKGICVIAAGDSKGVPTFLSKYCKNRILYTSPQKNADRYLMEMLESVKNGGYKVLMPLHDFELIPIVKEIDKFLKYTEVPFPDYETLVKTLDKSKTLEIAIKNNIPVPKTYFVNDINEVNHVSKEINYPAVIKPRSQTNWDGIQATTVYVTGKNYVKSPKDLIQRYFEIHNRSKYPLIQEYVKGGGFGVGLLFNHGKPRAAFAYKRLMEYPITGGPSTLRESIQYPIMVEYAIRLLKAMKWHGVAMVEFKVTKDDKPVLMEVNGRFWGSLALPYYAGMDFPYLLYKMAVDGDVKPQFDYKVGVKCRWLIPGDILHLLSAINDPNHSTGKAIKDFIKFREKDLYYDYFSWDDPLPAVGALITSLKYFGDFLRGKRSLAGEYR